MTRCKNPRFRHDLPRCFDGRAANPAPMMQAPEAFAEAMGKARHDKGLQARPIEIIDQRASFLSGENLA
jgi:hypothetical protein